MRNVAEWYVALMEHRPSSSHVFVFQVPKISDTLWLLRDPWMTVLKNDHESYGVYTGKYLDIIK